MALRKSPYEIQSEPQVSSPIDAGNASLFLAAQIEGLARLFSLVVLGISAVLFAVSFVVSWVMRGSFEAVANETVAHFTAFLFQTSCVVAFFSTILVLAYRWRFSSWKKKLLKVRISEPLMFGLLESRLKELQFPWKVWFLAIRDSCFFGMASLLVFVSVELLAEASWPLLYGFFYILLINILSLLMTSHTRRHLFEKMTDLKFPEELRPAVLEFNTIVISGSAGKSSGSKKSSGDHRSSGGGGGFSGGGASGKW